VFSREYPPVIVGGTSTVARNLATGLAANRWQVTVISADPHGDTDRTECLDGVTIVRVATTVVYNEDTSLSDASIRVHRGLYRAALSLAGQDGPPDAVAIPDLFCCPEASLLARQYRVPLVNILLQDFRTLTAYDRDQHRVTSGVNATAGDLFELEEKALRSSDHTVFISRALADAIGSYYPRLPRASSVIHLGVDTREIASIAGAAAEADQLRRSLPSACRRLVVACGRLVPVKGFDPLLRAVAAVDRPGLHLVIIGVGPEASHLARLADQLGLTAKVTFTGPTSRRTALTWMSIADVGVVPSLWESFCYVCAEMMAFGRPVVASTVDSLSELMPTEEFGYRVPAAGPPTSRVIDPGLLAGALQQALADPAAATRRGAAARERILTEFSNARFTASMSALLGTLTGSTP